MTTIANRQIPYPRSVEPPISHRKLHWTEPETKESIPAEQPGETGVTWKYLYVLAVRGDLKGRRTLQSGADRE